MAADMLEAGRRTRVFVVDDDEEVRLSLCALLTAHGYDAIGAATAADFLEQAAGKGGLCAFIDLRMPGMGGLELQKEMARAGMMIQVIILTAYGDVPLAVEAMKSGAIDFIEKPGSEAQIFAAIDAAANAAANRPQPRLPSSVVAERLGRLTGRERHVLNHLVLGKTNKQIAEEFGISQRTVEIHRARIREKMEARGLADLIRMMR
jgi:two-component system response regulator FixJ